MKQLIRKAITLTLVSITLCSMLAGCAKKDDEKIVEGVIDRSPVEQKAFDNYQKNNDESDSFSLPEKFETKFSTSLNSMLLELNAGRLSYFNIPKCTAEYITKSDKNLNFVDGNAAFKFRMATRPEDVAIRDEINSAIESLKVYGELDGIIEKYITNASGEPVENSLIANPDGDTYMVGITGDLPPMDYVAADGTPAGFNVALLNAIAEIKGCNFEVVQVDAAARTVALTSGKIDIIFWIGCLETEGYVPESEDMLLTESYYRDISSFVTKDFPIAKIREINGIE